MPSTSNGINGKSPTTSHNPTVRGKSIVAVREQQFPFCGALTLPTLIAVAAIAARVSAITNWSYQKRAALHKRHTKILASPTVVAK